MTIEDACFGRQAVSGNHTKQGRQGERENEPKLVSMVLRAYCLALIKACDRVYARVTKEYFYEVRQVVCGSFNQTG